MSRAVLLAVLAAMAAPGCGSSASTSAPSASGVAAPAIYPLFINSEITPGPNRFLFSLTDQQNRLVAAPGVTVRLSFFDVDTNDNKLVFEADAVFMWAIEDVQGLYRADIEFPDAGRWRATFEATFPDGRAESVRADFDVAEAGSTPALGAVVPSIKTPTIAGVGGDLAQVTTDSAPVERFYETSIDAALAAGEPFVVSFATPAFCETRLCGPVLETVKEVAANHPDLTFINVEPYRMTMQEGRLQPEFDTNRQLQAADWTTAWGLRSEPFTFVVRADGTLAAKFEGVIGADELAAAIEAL